MMTRQIFGAVRESFSEYYRRVPQNENMDKIFNIYIEFESSREAKLDVW